MDVQSCFNALVALKQRLYDNLHSFRRSGKNSVSKNHKLSTVSLFIHGRFSLSVYRTSPFLTISPLLTISRLTYSLQSHSPGFKSRFHFLFDSLRPRKHRRLQFVLSNGYRKRGVIVCSPVHLERGDVICKQRELQQRAFFKSTKFLYHRTAYVETPYKNASVASNASVTERKDNRKSPVL